MNGGLSGRRRDPRGADTRVCGVETRLDALCRRDPSPQEERLHAKEWNLDPHKLWQRQATLPEREYRCGLASTTI
jgi:hypothetical protein